MHALYPRGRADMDFDQWLQSPNWRPRITHRALLQQDILSEVFQCLLDVPKYHRRKNNLLAASLVCRTWCSPALDACWSQMDTLNPLLKLIPSIMDGTPELQDLDLSRYQIYARRIRELRLDTGGDDNADVIPSAILGQVFLALQVPLLPNLRLLKWYINLKSPFTADPIFFFAPSLRTFIVTVRVTGDDSEDTSCGFNAVQLVLAALVQQVPHLKTLTLHGDMRVCCLGQIGELKRLENLEVHPYPNHNDESWKLQRTVDKATFASLATLENLTALRVLVHCLDIVPLKESYLFPKLQGLYLRGSLRKMTDVLRSLVAPALRDVILEPEDEGLVGYRLLFAAIHPSLTQLRVSRKFVGPVNESLVAEEIFPSLSHLVNLDRLFIRIGLYSIRDEDIASIAPYWKKLQYLYIVENEESFGRPHPTVHALITLASHCPSLKHIAMPVDVVPLLRSDVPVLNHGLLVLDIRGANRRGELDDADIRMLARQLGCLFPHLHAVLDAWGTLSILRTFRALGQKREQHESVTESAPTMSAWMKAVF
ncbi:hypothetical protein OE88DRAFT_476548 [Heliocybe sulcata]|uniref:F-box domain-containing protein n=1 Tax=Heliocybe sulcata TaxID=5364 RepID=A0A5C3N600_9AGAM|nr:hypothetical protein OE88DRAFT_476548 [Heliocybe sulcata]